MRHARVLHALAGVVVVGLAAWNGPVALAAKTPEVWTDARSENFRVIGPHGTNPAKLAQRMEVFRSVLERRGHGLATHEPVTIVLLSGESALAETAADLPRTGTKYAGVTLPYAQRPYVLVNAKDPAEDKIATSYRGYLDICLALEKQSVPLWFREGLAAYYQTFGVTRSSALIGRAVQEYVVYLRSHELIPLVELLSMKRPELDRLPPEKRLRFTAESWVLVHSGFSAGYTGKRQLSRLMELQERGVEPAQAVRDAYGIDVPVLEGRLREYVRTKRHTYTAIEYDPPAERTAVKVAKVNSEDVLRDIRHSAAGDVEFVGLVRSPLRTVALEYPLPGPRR